MVFLKEVYKRVTHSFSPLEQQLIQAFIDELPAETAEIISKQVAQYNKVQRLYNVGAVEVNLYKTGLAGIVQELDVKFPVEEEIKLGTVVFYPESDKPTHVKWKGDFYAVNGRFFSIVIRPNPKSIQQSSVEIVSVHLQDDPLNPKRTVHPSQPQGSPPILPDWLREWQERYEVSHLSDPLSAQRQQDLLAKVEATLPPDYLDLLRYTDGLVINNCSILGLSEIHNVHLPDSDYLVLVEIHGRGILGVRTTKQESMIYYYAYEGKRPEACGMSLRRAVEKYLEH